MAQVLIVDDEEELADLLRLLLEDLGHEPVLATNGRQALQVLSTLPQPPQLIISDIMMPFMNGIELVKQLKQDQRYQHVPLILMSAAGLPTTDYHFEFLTKPFELDTIIDLIERLINAA